MDRRTVRQDEYRVGDFPGRLYLLNVSATVGSLHHEGDNDSATYGTGCLPCQLASRRRTNRHRIQLPMKATDGCRNVE